MEENISRDAELVRIEFRASKAFRNELRRQARLDHRSVTQEIIALLQAQMERNTKEREVRNNTS